MKTPKMVDLPRKWKSAEQMLPKYEASKKCTIEDPGEQDLVCSRNLSNENLKQTILLLDNFQRQICLSEYSYAFKSTISTFTNEN